MNNYGKYGVVKDTNIHYMLPRKHTDRQTALPSCSSWDSWVNSRPPFLFLNWRYEFIRNSGVKFSDFGTRNLDSPSTSSIERLDPQNVLGKWTGSPCPCPCGVGCVSGVCGVCGVCEIPPVSNGKWNERRGEEKKNRDVLRQAISLVDKLLNVAHDGSFEALTLSLSPYHVSQVLC